MTPASTSSYVGVYSPGPGAVGPSALKYDTSDVITLTNDRIDQWVTQRNNEDKAKRAVALSLLDKFDISDKGMYKRDLPAMVNMKSQITQHVTDLLQKGFDATNPQNIKEYLGLKALQAQGQAMAQASIDRAKSINDATLEYSKNPSKYDNKTLENINKAGEMSLNDYMKSPPNLLVPKQVGVLDIIDKYAIKFIKPEKTTEEITKNGETTVNQKTSYGPTKDYEGIGTIPDQVVDAARHLYEESPEVHDYFMQKMANARDGKDPRTGNAPDPNTDPFAQQKSDSYRELYNNINKTAATEGMTGDELMGALALNDSRYHQEAISYKSHYFSPERIAAAKAPYSSVGIKTQQQEQLTKFKLDQLQGIFKGDNTWVNSQDDIPSLLSKPIGPIGKDALGHPVQDMVIDSKVIRNPATGGVVGIAIKSLDSQSKIDPKLQAQYDQLNQQVDQLDHKWNPNGNGWPDPATMKNADKKKQLEADMKTYSAAKASRDVVYNQGGAGYQVYKPDQYMDLYQKLSYGWAGTQATAYQGTGVKVAKQSGILNSNNQVNVPKLLGGAPKGKPAVESDGKDIKNWKPENQYKVGKFVYFYDPDKKQWDKKPE